MKTYIGYKDVKDEREVQPHHMRPLTGADRRVSRHPDLVSWLSKAYVEIEAGARDWPFNGRKLREFLRACGVDIEGATKSDEDALPMPDDVCDVAICMDRLKGASFLNGPVGNVCMFLHRRSQVAPRRR